MTTYTGTLTETGSFNGTGVLAGVVETISQTDVVTMDITINADGSYTGTEDQAVTTTVTIAFPGQAPSTTTTPNDTGSYSISGNVNTPNTSTTTVNGATTTTTYTFADNNTEINVTGSTAYNGAGISGTLTQSGTLSTNTVTTVNPATNAQVAASDAVMEQIFGPVDSLPDYAITNGQVQQAVSQQQAATTYTTTAQVVAGVNPTTAFANVPAMETAIEDEIQTQEQPSAQPTSSNDSLVSALLSGLPGTITSKGNIYGIAVGSAFYLGGAPLIGAIAIGVLTGYIIQGKIDRQSSQSAPELPADKALSGEALAPAQATSAAPSLTVGATAPTTYWSFDISTDQLTFTQALTAQQQSTLDQTASLLGVPITNAVGFTLQGGQNPSNPNDVLVGGSGDDTFIGGTGNETMSGGGGNDTFEVGTGSDVIDGGPGQDKAIFSGIFANYTIGDTGATVTVSSGSVTDTLTSVETLQFADATASVAANVLTTKFVNGARSVATFNITGQRYTTETLNYDETGRLVSALYSGDTTDSYSSFAIDYSDGAYVGTELFFTSSGEAYHFFGYKYSVGGALIGSQFFYTDVTGQAYSSETVDYDGGRNLTQVDFVSSAGAPYSSYEYDYVGGAYAGAKFTFTSVSTSASYSSYETDYDETNTFIGDKFFFTDIAGKAYTTEEVDFDAAGNVVKVLLGGFSATPYSSLELEYRAGVYAGYEAFYTEITGQSYTGVEVDVSAQNQITKAVYTGLTNAPYSSVEEDFSGGALTSTTYDFTSPPSGQNFYAYQAIDDAAGHPQQEIVDNNDGSHTIVGFQDNQTFTSIGNDTFTGGGANETFVFTPVYGHDTITDFASHLTGTGHDTISLSTSEFANFAALMSDTQNVGSNAMITAANGDTITLDNVTAAALAANRADFTFHA